MSAVPPFSFISATVDSGELSTFLNVFSPLDTNLYAPMPLCDLTGQISKRRRLRDGRSRSLQVLYRCMPSDAAVHILRRIVPSSEPRQSFVFTMNCSCPPPLARWYHLGPAAIVVHGVGQFLRWPRLVTTRESSSLICGFSSIGLVT